MYAKIDQHKEAIAEKEHKIAHLELLNKQLEESMPNLDSIVDQTNQVNTQKLAAERMKEEVARNQEARRQRIEAMRAKVAQQRQKLEEVRGETGKVRQRVHLQPMTK